jgi:hypothetical protein
MITKNTEAIVANLRSRHEELLYEQRTLLTEAAVLEAEATKVLEAIAALSGSDEDVVAGKAKTVPAVSGGTVGTVQTSSVSNGRLTADQAVLAVFADAGRRTLSTDSIFAAAKALGWHSTSQDPRNIISQTCARLATDDRIRRVSRGMYTAKKGK